MRPKVFARIPQTGLGNCMLVWAHALVFAKKNGLQMITGSWAKIRYGALVRREKKKRLYFGYFREAPLINRIGIKAQGLFKKKVYNPHLNLQEKDISQNTIYIFNKLPGGHYFEYLYKYEIEIKKCLYDILSARVRREYDNSRRPDIGVHIRRGDFKVANHITSTTYFIGLIREIRYVCGEELSVTVFTDADESEISDILSLPGTVIARNKYDITDLLQFSNSRFLLLSRDSTFSYWGAFLSEGMVIMHSGDWQKRIKPDHGNYLEFRYSERESNKELSEIILKRNAAISK